MHSPESNTKENQWRLKFAVTAVIIAIFMGFLLKILNKLQKGVEIEKVRSEVQYLRLGLVEAWISRNIAHKNTNISTFENTNPMLLIANIPKNYAGEFTQAPSSKYAVWYYDTGNRQLVYVLNNGDFLRYQLKKSHRNPASAGLPNGGLDLVEIEN